jgi:hypothetical protein
MTVKQRFTILAAAVATVLSLSTRVAQAELPECIGTYHYCVESCPIDTYNACQAESFQNCRNLPSVEASYCWLDDPTCPGGGGTLWCTFGDF